MAQNGAKWRKMNPKEARESKQKLTIKDELLRAANKKIAELDKIGVAQGRTDIFEPEQQHLPVLVDLGDFKNWLWDAGTSEIDLRTAKKEDLEKVTEYKILRDVDTTDGFTKKCHSVMILGPAGMGKTTFLRRIAQNAMRGKYKELEGKLILMLDFRPHVEGKEISPSQVLLGDMFPDWGSEGMKKRYQWIIDNPEKLVFIIDSLDCLPFDLAQEKRVRLVNRPEYHKSTTADVILCNILAKDWFPGSVIISSSREYKFQNLHPSFRPDRCVLLDGLTEESVEDLIDGFFGKARGAEVKRYIKTECPDIWPALSVPVVLIFSMIGLTEGGLKPRTTSGILIMYLQILIRSSHARVKNISEVLSKLMPLAFSATRDQCALFTLDQFGLEPEEVDDFVDLIPQSQGTFLSTKLMQNNHFFVQFSHPMVQEALSALHALSNSIDIDDFKKFVVCDIWKGQFAVVRRLTCGILLNDEVLEDARYLTDSDIVNVSQKKAILLQNLRENLEQELQNPKKSKLLEICIDLNEAKNGATELVRTSIPEIDFKEITLSQSDVQSIAFVTKQCRSLKSFDLTCCCLDDAKIKILHKTVLQSNVKVEKVSLARNTSIGEDGMKLFGEFVRVCEAEKIDVHACNLQLEHLKNFSDGAGTAKVKYLDVSENTQMGSEGMHMVGKVVKHHEVEILDASCCNPKPDHIEKFVEGLGDAKLDKLNLQERFREPAFNPTLFKLLPCVKKELNLVGWSICENKCQELNQKRPKLLQIQFGDGAFSETTLDTLDSSGNRAFIQDKKSQQKIHYDAYKPLREKSSVFCIECEGIKGPEERVLKIVTEDEERTEREVERTEREVEHLLMVTRHENVVKYFQSGFCKYRGKDAVYILMEKCERDTIWERYHGKNEIPFPQRKFEMRGAGRGIRHIHENRIVHRDVKPHNILVKDGKIVISDFGLSKKLSPCKSNTQQSLADVGTDGWRAPETGDNVAKTTKASDIFSYGLVSHYMLTNGKHPYGDKPRHWIAYIENGTNLSLDGLDSLPDGLLSRDLIGSMLQREPDDRPSIGEVLSHPFFWNGRRKLEFISDVCKNLELVEKGEFLSLNDKSGRYADKMDMCNWKDCLDFSEPELQKLQGKAKQKKAEENKAEENKAEENKEKQNKAEENKTKANEELSAVSVKHDSIKKKVGKKAKDCVSDVIRFIRNRYAHDHEDKSENICMTVEELWKFFDKRFPYLLLFVYHKMKVLYTGKCPDDKDYSKTVAEYFNYKNMIWVAT